MRFSPLIAIVSGAVVISYFLPWFRSPFGGSFVPHAALTRPAMENAANMPGEVAVFLLSFLLAAVVLLAALMGKAPRILVLGAGIVPAGLVIKIVLDAQSGAGELGLPVPSFSNVSDFAEMVSDFVDLGPYLYFGGAAVLLLIGFFGPAKAADQNEGS